MKTTKSPIISLFHIPMFDGIIVNVIKPPPLVLLIPDIPIPIIVPDRSTLSLIITVYLERRQAMQSLDEFPDIFVIV